MAETGFISVADLSLEYERLPGRRRGPTLVLLHEGLGCVAMWKKFPARLNESTGLAVFTYSRAGYGGSSAIDLPRPLDFHTRDALEVLPHVLDVASLEDSILLGHSDGASIAIVYAGARRDPRIRALILMAPHVLTEDKGVETIATVARDYESTDLRSQLIRYHGGARELYDLASDPHETTNVAADHPRVLEELSAKIHAWQTSCRASAARNAAR